MFDFFISGLSGYKNLKVLSKNTSLAIDQKGLNKKELIKRYNVKYVLSGSVTIFGQAMRTNIEIRDIKLAELMKVYKIFVRFNSLGS